MPGITPNDLPYPTGTDRVMDGDDAIKNLAVALRIFSGQVNLDTSVNPTPTVAVTFPVGLYTSRNPQVIAAIASSLWNTQATGVTLNGCNLSARNINGTAGSAGSQIRCDYMTMRVGNP